MRNKKILNITQRKSRKKEQGHSEFNDILSYPDKICNLNSKYSSNRLGKKLKEQVQLQQRCGWIDYFIFMTDK